MHRFLPGIVFLQLLTAVLVWVAGMRGDSAEWWYLLVTAAIVSLVTALWFATIARHRADSAVSQWRLKHGTELQKAKSEAVADRSRHEAKLQKEIRKVERRVGRRSSIKVSLAFGGMAALGVVMLLTELFTLGLLTISSAGSALGGYLLHWRQSRVALSHTPARDRTAGGGQTDAARLADGRAVGRASRDTVLTLPGESGRSRE